MGKQLIDNVLEKTVIPSFSSIGSSIRSRMYQWNSLDDYSMQGQVVVITGATSGIGEAGARRYARMGATLIIVARNPDKTHTLIESLKNESGNTDIHGVFADLGSQQEVRRAAQQLSARWPVIHVLVHNAGALFNQGKRAANGVDLSVELMVATPFLLTGLLLDNLRAAAGKTSGATAMPGNSPGNSPGRVLTMSSGGMYTEALNVDGLQMQDDHYQGAKQYARAKRAQVILNELWAEKVPQHQVVFHALHPGWVHTPGISEALPGFSRVLGPLGLLRSADDGADTMIWLSVEPSVAHVSGGFWHDRKQRDIDMSAKTRRADTAAERSTLWDWCEAHTDWHLKTNQAS